MFTTVVAILCHLIGAPSELPMGDCTPSEARIEEIVTDSSMDDTVTFMGCMATGIISVAKWKSEHPLYSKETWRLARFKCVPGHYEIKGQA